MSLGPTPRRLLVVAAGTAALTIGIVACSSSSNSSGGTSGGGSVAAGGNGGSSSACMTAAENYLKPWDTLPTNLSDKYTPLSKKPKPGGTVIKLVNGSIPSDHASYEQLAIAAKSVGWTAKEIVFNGTVEDLNAKYEQAISDKPTATSNAGWPPAAIGKPTADGKSAGVLIEIDSVSDPAISNPGYGANENGAATAKQIGEMNAYMFMRDSGCKGSVAIFNLPFPILKVGTDSFTATVKAHCPDCKVSYNEAQSKDIGTPALSNAVVSKLQSSPSTKYVYAIIGNIADGLPSAFAQAGLSGIKIFGQVPDETSIANLRNGTNAWWVNQNSLMNGWTEMDVILRVLDTGTPVTDQGGYPLAILTPANVPSGTAVPVIPTDYQEEFKKLWLVG
jgi:substrate-binding family protein